MSEYRDAGVDIDAGNKSEEFIGAEVKRTYNAQVISGVGGFGAVFSLSKVKKMKNPLLVSTMDGVGTKVKVAARMDVWDTVGADIVNHCSNDLAAMGAEPLFFLDYLASSKIAPEKIRKIVSGMANACEAIKCPLVGGETAEMPGVYGEGETDIVGCMVAVVEKKDLFDNSKIKSGDTLVGIASSGLHTNGYSLARKVLLDKAGFSLQDFLPELGCTIGEELLKVHKSYSKNIFTLRKKVKVKGIAHITGGGLYENVPRILPRGLSASYDYSTIESPHIFRLIQRSGGIPTDEMYRTFNMGVGLVVVVAKKDAKKTAKILKGLGERAWVLGAVIRQ